MDATGARGQRILVEDRMAGTYSLFSDSSSAGRLEGELVLVRMRAGYRIVGYTMRTPMRDTSDLRWVDAPFTFSDDDRFVTHIGVALIGKVLSDSSLLIESSDTVDGAELPWRLLLFLKQKEDATHLVQPTGAYNVAGSRGASRWAGRVAIVRSPIIRGQPPAGPYLTYIRVEAAGEDGQELTMNGPADWYRTGALIRKEETGARLSARGDVAAGQLSLTIDAPLPGHFTQRTTLAGSKN